MKCNVCTKEIPKSDIIAKRFIVITNENFNNDYTCLDCHQKRRVNPVIEVDINENSIPKADYVLLKQLGNIDPASIETHPCNLGVVINIGIDASKWLKKNKVTRGSYVQFMPVDYKDLLNRYVIVPKENILSSLTKGIHSQRLFDVFEEED